jgi:hypothetical protein
MAQLIGTLTRVQDLIDRARTQGCELRQSERQLVTPYGTKTIRFLFNPANRGRFDITEYDNDELMVGSAVMAAERRLGIKICN